MSGVASAIQAATEGPSAPPAPRLTAGLEALLRFGEAAKVPLTISVLLALPPTLLELAPFLLIYLAVDALASGTSTADGLALLAILAVLATLIRSVLWGVAMFVSHVASFDVVYELRLRMAGQLARLPLGYFDARRSGEIKRNMAEDVDRLDGFLAHGIPELISAFVVWVLITVWMLIVDWRLALAAIVVVPLAFLLLRRALAHSAGWMDRSDRVEAHMNGAIVEVLNGLPVLKMVANAGSALRESKEAIEANARLKVAWSRAWMPLGTALFILVSSNVAVILPVGLGLYLADAVSVSTVFLFFIVGIGYSIPLLRFYHHAMFLALMSYSGARMERLLAERPLPDTGRRVDLADASVEFIAVSFSYEERLTLDAVSFRAEPGTVTALVGPSGAGKTSIARLIPRFWDVNGGRIAVGGVDVREMSMGQLMENVAFVLQEPFLFGDTIAANIRIGRDGASDDEIVEAARAARAHEFIERLPDGYETVVGERGRTLSGGERQRIAIAAALLKVAPIVVLDEATAFADPESEAAIQDAVARLVAGRTLIVVAHRLWTITEADQILVVEGGRIAERGRHHELLALGGTYHRLWADLAESRRATPSLPEPAGEPA